MSWQETYDDQIIRAIFLLRGVPRDPLPERLQRVADEIIEEFGEGAYVGFGAQLTGVLAQNTALFLIEIERAYPDPLTQENVGPFIQGLRRGFANYSRSSEILARTGVDQAISLARQAHVSGITQAAAVVEVSVSTEAFAGFAAAVREQAALREVFIRPVEQVVRNNLQNQLRVTVEFVQSLVDQDQKKGVFSLLEGLFKQNDAVRRALAAQGTRGKNILSIIGRTTERIRGMSGEGLYSRAKQTILQGMNAMHHEAMVHGYTLSPMVEVLKWNLSATHSIRDFAPDVCDLLARANPTKKGPGLYPPEICPSLPHPFCECFPTPVYRDPSKWNESRGKITDPELLSESQVETLLKQLSRDSSPSLTEARLKAQLQMANRRIQQANKAYRKSA